MCLFCRVLEASGRGLSGLKRPYLGGWLYCPLAAYMAQLPNKEESMSLPVTLIQTLSAFVIFVAGYLITLGVLALIGFAGMMVYLAVIQPARHTRKVREKFIARLRE